MNRILLVGPLFLVASLFASFASAASTEVDRLNFRTFDAMANEVLGSVNAIAQDSRGFLWFGTRQGAYRYDSNRIKSFRHDREDPGSMAHDTVWCFLLDSQQRLWIGTQRGISRFLPETESFKRYLAGDRWPYPQLSNQVNAIVETSAGEIIASTEAGFIYRLDAPDDRFVQLNSSPFGVIKSMARDHRDRLWIGVKDAVIRCDSNGGSTKRYADSFDKGDDITTNFINSILCLDEERVWVGTSNSGVAILDPASGDTTLLPVERAGEQYVNHIVSDASGIVWVTSNAGITAYEEGGLKTRRIAYDTENGNVPISGVNTLLRDRQGNIWIGSHFDSISVASNGKQFIKEPLHKRDPSRNPNAPVSAFLKDREGNLWVGDAKSGVDVFPDDGGAVRHYDHDPANPNSIGRQPVLEIFQDSYGEIWLGTFRGGLYRYRPETNDFQRFTSDPDDPGSISGQDIRGIVEDEKGNLWINTHGSGIDYLDRESMTFSNLGNSSPNARYTLVDDWGFAIHYDHLSRLWVGMQLGLSVVDTKNGSVRSYKADPSLAHSLSNTTVKAIFQDSQDRIWLGTEDGLNLYDPSIDGFRSFSAEHGLPHSAITTIIEDDAGDLWLGTIDGLARFNPETLETRTYRSGDGLASDVFFDGSALKDERGWIYFGQDKGITRFMPSELQDNTDIPPVYLTDIQVFNQSLPIQPQSDQPGVLRTSPLQLDTLELRHDQKAITIEFAALNFIHPDENEYAYKLEGFDNDWIHAGGRASATYTNLSPDSYVFRLKAANNDGFWNHQGASLNIRVLPPFWGTFWFRGLAILTATAIPAGWVLWRINSIKSTKRQLEIAVATRTCELSKANADLEDAYAQILAYGETLEDTVKRRTAELEIAKSKAERSDRLKSAFLANMSHEIRTPMNAIMGFLHFLENDDITASDRDRYGKIIRQSGQSLLKLIDDILDLSAIEAGEADIELAPTDIDEICYELRDFFKAQVAQTPAKEVEVVLEIDKGLQTPSPESAYIDIDALRLKQILWNLISNAIKFTEKGEIRFGYRIVSSESGDPQHVVFIVQDTGVGIPEEQCQHIFDRFYKIERRGQKLYRGTGLGLTITKKLTELMGGQIAVESNLDQGARFTVTFPYQRHGQPRPSIAPNPAKTAAGLTADHDFSGYSILVAEDEEPNFEYIKKVLKATKVGIEWARDGVDALELFASHQFDLVLLDLKMPRKDGLAVAREIRARDREIPIITVSAFAMRSDVQAALQAGANEHLSKPFHPRELTQAMHRQFDRREPTSA